MAEAAAEKAVKSVKESKTWELLEGLVGTMIFLDLFENAFGSFGAFRSFGFWDTTVLASVFFSIGFFFLLLSKGEEVERGRVAAGVCFVLGVVFLVSEEVFKLVVARFSDTGVLLLKITQFLLETGLMSFVVHDLFRRIYPQSMVTGLLKQVSVSLLASSFVLFFGLLFFSL